MTASDKYHYERPRDSHNMAQVQGGRNLAKSVWLSKKTMCRAYNFDSFLTVLNITTWLVRLQDR